jgi:hypothetical protein
LWAPVRTLREVAEGRRVLLAFIVVAVYAALGLVSSAVGLLGGGFERQIEAQSQQLPPGFENILGVIIASSLVVGVLAPFVYWLVVAGVMHLVTRFFGGTGPFSGTLAVVGVAQAPLVLSSVISLLLTLLGLALSPGDFPQGGGTALTVLGALSGLIGLAALVWSVVLVVIGAALARRIGYGESAGSCAISCAGCLGLIILVAVALGVIIALAFGGLGSGTS